MYFNNEMSLGAGRRLGLNKCVKNPRPDEIAEALKQLGYRSICHHDKRHPSDWLHPGRIKFKMFDTNGN